jgi:hypothetical protein
MEEAFRACFRETARLSFENAGPDELFFAASGSIAEKIFGRNRNE